MKTYIGAKIIQAEPMSRLKFMETVKMQTVIEGEADHDGYKVAYADGYVSWSPQEVFDEAYREVSDDETRIFIPDKDDPEVMKKIARVCHEVNRAYCQALGDDSQLPWEDAPDWQKNSAIKGVLLHVCDPYAGPRGSHDSWMAQKRVDGWKYGPVKDAEKKEHPCMVPFCELPREQQAKDYIFRAVVHALREG